MSNWHDRRERDREHEYELRRHEPRPGDRGFSAPGNEPPARFATPPTGALSVAILVKGLANITDAAGLIEQYAQTVAAEARLQAVIDTGERILTQIGASNAQT